MTGLNLRDDVLLSWSLNLNGPGWGDGVGVLVFCHCPSSPPLPAVTSTADFCFFGRHVVCILCFDVPGSSHVACYACVDPFISIDSLTLMSFLCRFLITTSNSTFFFSNALILISFSLIVSPSFFFNSHNV